MKKKIKFKTFIPLQIVIMIIVAIVYFLVIPKIKPMCETISKCANALDCNCNDYSCTCKYQDENDNIENIDCQFVKDK